MNLDLKCGTPSVHRHGRSYGHMNEGVLYSISMPVMEIVDVSFASQTSPNVRVRYWLTA